MRRPWNRGLISGRIKYFLIFSITGPPLGPTQLPSEGAGDAFLHGKDEYSFHRMAQIIVF
jgi:hypothetical protein